MDLSNQDIFDVQYSMLSEPGDAVAGILFQELGSELAIRELLNNDASESWPKLFASIGAEEYISTLPETIERFRLRIRHLDPERAVERHAKLGGELVFVGREPKVRSVFEALGIHAPLVLWVRGDRELLAAPGIAIVGSREASRDGLVRTKALVRLLPQNYCVVSGGAKGVDGAAHETALELGIPTIAYMAGGSARLYPSENVGLFERIATQGLVVSEVAPEVAPTRWRFLQRNRLIASHARLTVVIEAALRSGARNTAGHAFASGKKVLAFPGPDSYELSKGCNQLIRDGIARPITHPEQIQHELIGNLVAEQQRTYTSSQVRVLDSLYRNPRSLERICLESGLSRHDALQALKQLMAYRLVFNTPRGWMLA